MCDTYMALYLTPKIVVVKNRKSGKRSKIFLFSKTAQDCGNISTGICVVMQAVEQAGNSLSMQILQSLWFVY